MEESLPLYAQTQQNNPLQPQVHKYNFENHIRLR